MLTTVDVKIPVPRVRWYSVDIDDVAMFIFGLLIFAVLLSGIWWGIQSSEHRPKVVTKTVTESALSGAQQAYIKQCEQNSQSVPDSDNMNHGIPNVSTTPWSCTYANTNK